MKNYMETREKLEIDIECKDLLWEFVRGWRVIAALALVGGISMGAMSYISSYQQIKAAAVPKETVTETVLTAQEVIDSLSMDELPDVVAAVELKQQIDEKTAYLQNSVLMQIDPFKEQRISFEYYLTGADTEGAKSSYENLFANGSFAKDSNANELISVLTSKDSDLITIVVIHKDEESCEALAESVKEAMAEHTKTLKSLGMIETADFVNETQNVVTDDALHAHQDAYLKECMEDQTTLLKMKADMNAKEVSGYLHMWNLLYGEQEENPSAPADNKQEAENLIVPEVQKASVSLKQVGIGMVLGAGLGIVSLFVAYLLTGKLRTANEVEKLYGVKLLGTMQGVPKKKRLFAAVDRAVFTLSHLGRKLSAEEEIKLAAASTAIQCQNKQITKVYVSSSRMEAVPQELCQAFEKELAERGIAVQFGSDVAGNAKLLAEAAKVGSLVLIEKERQSAYRGMQNCVRMCTNNQIEILGMVVVEQ